MFPASHCPNCDTPVKPIHNIPVIGWLLLRGRCASCQNPISVRYPMVEVLTSLMFVAVTLRFGLSLELPSYLFLGAVTLTLVAIDLDDLPLPDSIVLPAYVVGALLLMSAGASNMDWVPAVRSAAGLAAYLTIFFLLALVYPHAVSFADAKLGGLLGMYLGWVSWSAVAMGTACCLAIAGVGGAVALVHHRGGGVMAVRLVPAIGVSAMVALLVAQPALGELAVLVR